MSTISESRQKSIPENSSQGADAHPLPAPHSELSDDSQAGKEEWLEKACFRATYRTLQNDAEYAKFDQQLQTARKEIANLREVSRTSELKLAAIENSCGYRLLRKLQAARLVLLPPNSKRERLCATVPRALGSLSPRRATQTILNDAQFPPRDSTANTFPLATTPVEEAALVPNVSEVDKTHDSDTDWHLGFGSTRFSPAAWPTQNDSASDDRFIKLVILSVVHRAGSTLLQRLCNARKGTLVWGEHGGVLQHYADIYAGAAYFSAAASHERDAYFSGQEDPNCWIANMTPDLEYVQQATVESARTFLNTLYGQYGETHDMIGFKEVRYVRGEIELLRKCYPEASILLLFRNPLNTWNSTPREWYPSFETWVSKWNRNAKCFLDFSKSDPHCHLLRYEDLIHREKSTMDMLSDVAKITPEHIAQVMSHKIGSAHWGISESERQTILEQSHEMMTALRYLD
jgi:hypothetical protein